MRRFTDRRQMQSMAPMLVLVVVAIVVFHVAGEFAVIFGWILAFFGIIAPFVWGFMLAYALNIPREYFEALIVRFGHPAFVKWRRGLSVLLTYAAFVAVVSLVLNLILPQVYESVLEFVEFVPYLIADMNELLVNLDVALPFLNLAEVAGTFTVDDLLGELDIDNLTAAIGTILGLTGAVFRAALALISSVYFLIEAERIKAFAARVVRAFMPDKLFGGFARHVRDINTYFKRYIFCQVLDAVILGTIMTIAMSVMGVSYALVLGPMLGVANLIPYFGSIVGTIAAIIIILVTEGMQMGLIATIVLIVLQQIDANFIFPRLLGGQMKIPPLLVIIGIAIGGAFYGIIGMIMAIPMVTVLRNIIVEVLGYVEERKRLAVINEELRMKSERGE